MAGGGEPAERTDVRSARRALEEAAQACSQQGDGAAVRLRVVVDGTGRVIQADAGALADSPAGACAVRAALAARFPATGDRLAFTISIAP